MRRADLHQRFAEWLDGVQGEVDEIVGYHLEQAHRCLQDLGRADDRARALAGKAAERLGTSGLRANGRGDVQAATNLLQRATALLRPDDKQRLALMPVLGRALREVGRPDEADAVLAQAVEQAGAIGERGIAADAGVALTDLRLHRTTQTGVSRQDALREVDAAVQDFEETNDDAGLGRALWLAGKLRFWHGDAAAASVEF